MTIPDAAIGSIVAAVIAAAFAFIALILTKEQKTSEFRQNWIDSIREDISEYIGISDELGDILALKIKESSSAALKYLTDHGESVQKAHTLYVRILLRANPVEHKRLIELLKQVQSMYGNHAFLADSTSRTKLVEDICAESQTVLKREWKRVKKGETTFVIAKNISIGILVFGLLISIPYLFNHISISWI